MLFPSVTVNMGSNAFNEHFKNVSALFYKILNNRKRIVHVDNELKIFSDLYKNKITFCSPDVSNMAKVEVFIRRHKDVTNETADIPV